jgi:hypothetical protein
VGVAINARVDPDGKAEWAEHEVKSCVALVVEGGGTQEEEVEAPSPGAAAVARASSDARPLLHREPPSP